MKLTNKNITTNKTEHGTTKVKQVQEIKNIGLDKKIAEAKRLYRLLENPELLR